MTNSVSVTTPYDDEIGVSSKKFQESSTSHQQQFVVDLGLKLEQDNQDRPFVSKSKIISDNDQTHDDDKNNGPTYNSYNNSSNIINSPILYSTTTSPTSVVDNNTSCVAHCSTTTPPPPPPLPPPTTTANGGYVRGSGLQPFDVICSSYVNPFLKYSGGMATTTMGFPFTAAQWKELERQAMIYKYMMASLPIPPHLLYSSFPTQFSTSSTFAPASYFLGKYGSEISMRWSGNNKDAEPGRCRRTDGKKWRCSKDVAPNQKYCERHMHRGRPRSRKHVEQQLLQQQQHSPSNLSFNTTNDKNNDDNVPMIKKTKLTDSCSIPQCVGSSCSTKGSMFDRSPLVCGGNSNPFEISRNLAWNNEQQWNDLVQQASMNSSVFQNQFDGQSLHLNSQTGFNSKSTDMSLLERPLIDAWSMGISGNKNLSDKGSLSSLNGVDTNANAINEEICQIHMGLGLIDSWASTTPTPGGPLAEVLRPNNPTISDVGESEFVTPPATAVSSPSGVLQKNFATFSDSSGSNSPTTCNNSKGSSEMPFNWLN